MMVILDTILDFYIFLNFEKAFDKLWVGIVALIAFKHYEWKCA